ncbi:hypothetical protein EGW08_022568, partial [Elysia chlorotica]
CLYSATNEWIKVEGNIARVGIDDYSQKEFGEIVYVDLPKVGNGYSKDEEACVIESVKTASDVCMPLSGKVIRVNTDLESNPSLINQSCYEAGWLFDMELSNESELKELIKPEDYKSYV